MARSSYVYVVLDGATPVAGFTVKHELVTWLRRHCRVDGPTVIRLRDNGALWAAPAEMDLTELLDD